MAVHKGRLVLRGPGCQRVGFHFHGQRTARRDGALGCRRSDDVVGGQHRAAVNARRTRQRLRQAVHIAAAR